MLRDRDAENKKLREALEFYADERCWITTAGNERRTIVKNDNDCESFGYQASPESKHIVVIVAGRLARQALGEVEK